MHSTPVAEILLRGEAFMALARKHGLKTVSAIADHIGISRFTVARVLEGTSAPGERFIASALFAFPGAKFEQLFAVVSAQSAQSRTAAALPA